MVIRCKMLSTVLIVAFLLLTVPGMEAADSSSFDDCIQRLMSLFGITTRNSDLCPDIFPLKKCGGACIPDDFVCGCNSDEMENGEHRYYLQDAYPENRTIHIDYGCKISVFSQESNFYYRNKVRNVTLQAPAGGVTWITIEYMDVAKVEFKEDWNECTYKHMWYKVCDHDAIRIYNSTHYMTDKLCGYHGHWSDEGLHINAVDNITVEFKTDDEDVSLGFMFYVWATPMPKEIYLRPGYKASITELHFNWGEAPMNLDECVQSVQAAGRPWWGDMYGPLKINISGIDSSDGGLRIATPLWDGRGIYASMYKDIEYAWHVQVGSAEVVRVHFVSLDAGDFVITQSDGRQCCSDHDWDSVCAYVAFYDPNKSIGPEACGNETLPPDFSSKIKGQDLFIRFVSYSNDGQQTGFLLELSPSKKVISPNDACWDGPKRITIKENGRSRIMSPKSISPELGIIEYPKNQFCSWHIHVPEAHKIKATFKKGFDILTDSDSYWGCTDNGYCTWYYYTWCVDWLMICDDFNYQKHNLTCEHHVEMCGKSLKASFDWPPADGTTFNDVNDGLHLQYYASGDSQYEFQWQNNWLIKFISHDYNDGNTGFVAKITAELVPDKRGIEESAERRGVEEPHR